jgi:hypothetical protein
MSRLFRSGKMGWAGHVALRWRREIHTDFWWGNLKENDHLKDLDLKGSIIIKLMLKKWECRVWTVFTWIRTQTNGRFLWRRRWDCGLHIKGKISWPAKELNFTRRTLLHEVCLGYFISDGNQDLLQFCSFCYLSVKHGRAKNGSVETEGVSV